MTQTKQHCSTPDQLLTFLRGQLSAREETDLQQHLDDCVACRERLENTAADASVWNEARVFFASGALHASTRSSSEEHEEANQGFYRIRQVLDSLGPTDDPESLGRIGGYEVTGVVGAGGMGVVLKAHDRSLDRIVAIKVMSPHLASSGSARKRFAREAKAAAAVLHPNVIAIHSVASEDANPYLVMPFVRGASLQKRIDSQGPLPLKDTLRIGAQIAAGLAAAHEQGLVHRDIKPANILLEEGVERVTITDFGLARAVDDASMTCSGVIAGTPQYMSPEQARGEPIDARSDLFSLGGVLYAMCTGRSPFRAETTYGVLHRIANDKPTPVCEVNTDVPVWLGKVIERLMAKRPEDRFESAAQVAELLEGCLAHVQQPTAMPLPSSVEQLSQLLPVSSSASQQAKKQLGQLFYNLPPIGKFIAAAAGAFALLFAGVLIVLELGKGTLTIESELENVPIRIMQGDKVVDRLKVTKSGNSVRVAAGTYVVEIDGQFHGIDVKDGNVTLGRRGEVVVKILQNVDEFLGHDTDIHSTREDHQYLVWEEDDRVRLSYWFAKAVRVDKETLSSINQLLSETWKRYIKLESQHTTYSRNSGRLIADVSKFTDERQPLESDFWTRLDEIVSGEQRALLHAISTARGDAKGDDTWPYRPKTLPSIIGWHERLFPVRVEIWTKGTWFYWRVSAGEYYVYGDGQTLPAELQHYWTIGNGEFGDKLFDTEMKQIDERLAKVVEGSTEYSLLTTKREQLQQQWDLSVAHVKGMAAAAKAESVTLQGEWEFISVESDGVITEYKTPRLRLTVAADAWTVQGGGGIETMSSNGHRVGIDGNKLTFHGMTTIAHELGGSEEIPTIGYGLWQVDGDTLTYLMTPAILAVKTFGPQPPIEFAESFKTKGTKNTVYRLRRVEASTPTIPSSSSNISPSKSSPEFPPVKIVVHDEEGKPLEGVKVSLYQLAKNQGGQVLEINETSNASGLAVNRNLPYGHYELSATTSDGWYLTGYGSRLNVEFEKGVDVILVAPTPGKASKLVISSDIATSPEKISGLRFGGLTEGNRTDHAPEPEGSDSSKEKEFSSFPTITNGIEYIGAEIRLEIWRNISQPAPSMQQMNTSWRWSRPPNSNVSFRYLIANGQARSFNEGYTPQNESTKRLPVEGSDFFKLPAPNYRVGAELLKLREPTQLPLELDIPAGNVRVQIGRFLGKPSAAVMAALNWQPQEQQPEPWLQAYIAPDSAWVEQLINMDWINSPFRSGGSAGFTALWHEQALRPGERLEIPLGMKHDLKTSLNTKAAGEEGLTIAAERSPTDETSSSKSSPEFPPVKILVHDEEGKPLEGVKVSLIQLAKDQGGQVLEINETSNASGLAVNRNLPYGHYELSATTADGWFLSGHGSKLNVEFEKGLSLKLVVPTPAPFGRLMLSDDANLRLAGSAGLRFGTLEELVNNGPAFSISPVPEPDGDLGEYSNFPTVTNGIEQVGIEIRFEMMAKNISQPSPSGTHLNSKWKWTPVDKAKSSCRYLIVDGQARAFVNQSVYHDLPFHGLPMEECEMFKLPSAKHRVGGSLFALHEPTAMPLEIAIPAGEMSIYVERIIGKPSLTTMKALNWEPHKDQPELWLKADVQRDSAWFERLIDTSAWIRTTLKPGYNEIAGHLQMHKLIRAGETLEVSLSPKPVDQKTSSASAARTLDDITSVYNDQTRQLRTELFNPPIPDLTTAQMRAAMLDAAEQYRKQGRVEVSSALKTSAETNRLSDRLTFMGMCGTMSDGFRQITPQFNFEAASNSALMVVLGKAELRYSRNGWSSKTWGDIHPPITGKWELVSVEEHGETLTQTAHDEWYKAHESWTELTIDATSLTMAGDNPAKLDFSVDYDAGLLPQYTIRQDGNTKYSGVLMGNGFIDDNKLVIAVDLEGSSTPQTFHTTDGKSTNLTYRRMPAKPQTEQVIAALVTFKFSGVVGNATLGTSGIGWVIDQRGHILVPDEIAPRSEDYSIEVRYADGSRTSAKRVFTFGHLALLKPEKAPSIVPIRLSSQRSVQDGEQVLAILNGTDVQKGTVTNAKKTIVSLDSWPILYVPRLRFPNAIETDFKSDAATLFGAPLLTPSGEVVGMLLNYKPPMFAIPLSEIQIACREFESSEKQSPIAAVKAAQGAPTPGLNDESKAPAIDHRNARAVVEAYVASALAGDVAKAASLAKNSPLIPNAFENFRSFSMSSD